MSEEFNIAVVIINQCMADPGAMSMFGPVSYKEINLKFSLQLLTTISRFG
jgi:RecA/RadA recombinase